MTDNLLAFFGHPAWQGIGVIVSIIIAFLPYIIKNSRHPHEKSPSEYHGDISLTAQKNLQRAS